MIHASTVSIGGRAVLITGPSGAGKSDLALRLIDRGAVLVSDDYTLLTRTGNRLTASAPETIAGRIEVRGIGIVAMEFIEAAPVAMAVGLDAAGERMPDQGMTRAIAGIAIPLITIDPRGPSAPIKVELALRRVAEAA